jgi:hypothetical protein
MRKSRLSRFAILVCLIVFVSVPMVAWAMPALPETVARAHTVFIQNDTGFTELQYSTVLELNKWGHFDLAESAEKADLILVLDNGSHVRMLPEGQVPSGNSTPRIAVPPGNTRISLVDPKSGQELWADVHRTDGGKVKNGGLLDGLREAFRAYDKARQ